MSTQPATNLAELPYWGVVGRSKFLKAGMVSPTLRPARPHTRNLLYITALIELRKNIPRHGTRNSRLLYFVDKVPPEIVHHIFGFLHPLDLYHLAQSSKSLKSVLLTPKLGSCWQTSFMSHSTFPPSPRGCIPVKWMHFLFGEAPCGFCNSKPTEIIEAMHLCRLCSECFKDRYTIYGHSYYEPFFGSVVSSIDPSLAGRIEMEICSALSTPTFRFRTDGARDKNMVSMLWNVHCEEIILAYSTLRRKARLGEEGAQSALDAYVAQRLEIMDEVNEVSFFGPLSLLCFPQGVA
ncbi:hypothetical protein BDN72DRAFT_578450 [Pluteus cervinus]|uniref:Uncharacterized protein n=1 Tax=Pluteus cervinus TaxID=181527 RepID=A0ACD3AVP1_9AGAR|nr:hypothetical protein BDN72DRAFT_578450 [Pluteus cervinus]